MDGIFIDPANMVVVRWFFLRGLGVIYFIAFASFAVQIRGLIGSHGISPASIYLKLVKEALGKNAFIQYPTLAWLNHSDRFLNGLCAAGMLLSTLLVFGVQVTPLLVLLWFLYLSLVVIGQDFLSFQWDVLLVEAGFLAVFLAPPTIIPQAAEPLPSQWVLIILRLLVFRLIFMSGALKLASRDPTWRSLTALVYHYETQPLPTPLAYYAARAPVWFHKISTLFTLSVETIIPLALFAPREIRFAAAGLSILLQLLIMLTGNFAFFNLLTLLLAIPLFDDRALQGIIPDRLLQLVPPALPAEAGSGWPGIIIIPLSVFLIAASVVWIVARVARKNSILQALLPVFQYLIAFRIVNPYGLFTGMTTRRPEIIIEGSDDGFLWKPYEFKYKIGDPKRSPRIVAPHQPRLDWQMWFAALGSYPESPWFIHLVECLLAGSQEVLHLIERNPFPDKPPRYIRALLYDYHYTTPEEKSKTGVWWRRDLIGLYLPPVSLDDG
jgi:hypothetical protein